MIVAILIGLSLALLVGYFARPPRQAVALAARRPAPRRRARQPGRPRPLGRCDRLHRPRGLAGLQRGGLLHRRGRVRPALRGRGEAETDPLRLEAGRRGRGPAPRRLSGRPRRRRRRARPASARSSAGRCWSTEPRDQRTTGWRPGRSSPWPRAAGEHDPGQDAAAVCDRVRGRARARRRQARGPGDPPRARTPRAHSRSGPAGPSGRRNRPASGRNRPPPRPRHLGPAAGGAHAGGLRGAPEADEGARDHAASISPSSAAGPTPRAERSTPRSGATGPSARSSPRAATAHALRSPTSR